MKELFDALRDARRRRDAAVSRVEKEDAELSRAEARLDDSRTAYDVLQRLAEQVQTTLHERLSSVVTKCLAAVFPDPYEFRLEFQRRKNRTEARAVFFRDGREFSPLRETGGGVVDVAAFALRVAVACVSRPPVRKLIVLDEPFRFLSAEYRDAARAMVETLAADLDVQFVIVTHADELRIGKVVEL